MEHLKRSDVEIRDGFVVMTVSYPLWESIPVDLRATEALIRARRPHGAPHYLQREIDRLTPPHCAVAVKASWLVGTDFWIPCARELADGADLCRMHGGPSKVARAQTESARMRQEIEDLRAELAKVRGAG